MKIELYLEHEDNCQQCLFNSVTFLWKTSCTGSNYESPRLQFLPLIIFVDFIGELCWGKAMETYTKPQQRKKEKSQRLRGERDQIKFIDLRFQGGSVAGLEKVRRRQDPP